MRFFALLLALLLTATAQPADKVADPFAPGKNLPGSFHPFNVTAVLPSDTEPEEKKGPGSPAEKYNTRNKFHCLISEYEYDPVVLLLVRGLEENAALRDLLEKLDGVIERNRKKVRLHAFVVFTDNELTNVLTQDEKREALVPAIARLAEDLKLRHVVLTLAGKEDLARYPLGDNSLIALLYQRLRIEAVHRVPSDKTDSALPQAVKSILADVANKFKATN